MVTASRWAHTAFVAARLQETGFAVAALCPRKGALRHTSGIDRFYDYSRLRRVQCALRAIRNCSPVLLVPGDDEAAGALYDLHARCRTSDGAEAKGVCQLIEGSRAANLGALHVELLDFAALHLSGNRGFDVAFGLGGAVGAKRPADVSLPA